MPLTVRKAIEKHPLNKSVVLAGKRGLDRIIELIGILDAPDSIKWVKPNEFIMTTGYIFEKNPVLQKETVKELYERQAAGLGIKLHRYIDNLPLEVINFANENNFPILALPYEASWNEIVYPIMMNILDNKQSVNETALETIKVFSNKILCSNGLPGLLRILYEIIKTPCSIFNKINKEIISYPFNFNPPLNINDMLSNSNHVNYTLIPHSNIMRLTNIKDYDKSIIAVPIVYKKNDYGYILVWENEDKLNYEQLITLEYAYMFACLNFKEFQKTKKELWNAQNKFLFSLLLEDIENPSPVFSNAYQLGIELEENYVVSVAEISSKKLNVDITSVKRNASKELQYFFEHLKNNHNILGGFGRFWQLFFLIPFPASIKKETKVKEIIKKVKKIQEEAEERFPNLIFSFGIGRYYPELKGVKKSYHEALETLRLGKIINGNGSVTHFCSLGVYRLLSNPEITPELQSFYSDYIAPLICYDKKYNTKLVETLKTYIETGYNYRNCAQKMFLHHNTIRYRLEKISKICNINLNSTEDLLNLHIALKIIPLLNK